MQKTIAPRAANILLILALFLWSAASYAEPFAAPIVYEKMHRTVNVDARGRYTETVELVSRIANEYGADRFGRHSFDHKITQESLKVVAAYNILPDGKIVRLAPDWIKKNNPKDKNGRNFNDDHTTTIAFPRVMVGSRLYSKRILTHFKPEKPDEFVMGFRISPHMIKEDYVTTLTAPKSLKLLVNQRGFEGGIIAESATSVTFRFHIKQTTAHKEEAGSTSYDDFAPFLIFTQAESYLDIGRIYHRSAAPKARVTPEIRKLALALTAESQSNEDKARQLYLWVAKNIRYISTTVDDGGLVPREAGYILRNRFGDCKDHVVILEALLRAVGIESTAALVNLGDAFELPPGPAAHGPLNHVISYIPSLDLYLDSTARFVPFGKLDDQVLDKPTILVALNRYGHTPKMRAENNTMTSNTAMTVSADGSIQGANTTLMTGTIEVNSRLARFHGQSEPMENTVSGLLYRFNEIGSGNITFTPPKDIEKTYEVGSTFTLDSIADLSKLGAFSLPIGLAPGHIAEMTIYKPLEKRDFPFICDSHTVEDNYTLKLPDNITINALPSDVNYKTRHVHYVSSYALLDNTLTVRRKVMFQYPSRKCPVDTYKELVDTLKILRKDHRAMVMYSPK